jgi:hypothetical protein
MDLILAGFLPGMGLIDDPGLKVFARCLKEK